MDFSISEIISLLKKRIWFIIVATFIALIIFYVKGMYLTNPTYTTSLQMYVSTANVTSTNDINELSYAQKIVNTYINFLKTKKFYQQVSKECGLNYSPGELAGMTSITSVNNTEIFQISVTASNPNDSYILALTMQNVVPDLIQSIKKSSEISVVDPASTPAVVNAPNILLDSILGGIIGLILAVLMILFWEIIDVNVKNQEDLSKKYTTPVLGVIPDFRLYRHIGSKILHSIPILKKYLKIRATKNAINKNSNFFVNESYNALRTNLRFTLRKDTCKKIIITSASPKEGKSTTSVNLAITLAHTGAKVMLLDCDLRKGCLHNFFQLKAVPGISDSLTGMINEKDVIQQTPYDNLEVITMGALPPNPNDLLTSPQMEELIKKLEKSYDYIIIDSSPVNIVSDILGLVKISDGLILVVREGVTSHRNVEGMISKFKLSQGNILGFVLNGVTMKQEKKYKSKYYK